jgi:beta-lactamase superfamily II metal-dependent hydrolase
MIFTLEALEARHGDSLLLHYGAKTQPKLIVIDGGPAGVYAKTLSKRLAAIKATRSPGAPMPIRMVMISHLDDDHINGILQLLKAQEDLKANGPLDYHIATIWHNAFDDLLDNNPAELTASLESAVNTAKAASAGPSLSSGPPMHRHGLIVLASVGQGRQVRDLTDTLGLTKNEGFSDKLVMVPEGKKGKNVSLGDKLTFTVLGPREERVRNLQIEWDKQIKKAGAARVAEFVDKSVFNLSSIIVLAKAGDKTMLLTGDARGDDILSGLQTAGLLKNGPFHVDLLKLPHHGSDHNVATEFFRRVTADHYVCSGNGEFGNPELPTLKMILEARGSAPYTIHLTNKEPRLETFFKDSAVNKKVKVIYRDPAQPSLRVDLSEPLS